MTGAMRLLLSLRQMFLMPFCRPPQESHEADSQRFLASTAPGRITTKTWMEQRRALQEKILSHLSRLFLTNLKFSQKE